MIKSRSTLNTLKEFLLKTRKRLSDESPDYSDMDDEQDPEGLDSELSEDGDDEASKWLDENDKSPDEADSAKPEYSEYEPDEDMGAHQTEAQKPSSTKLSPSQPQRAGPYNASQNSNKQLDTRNKPKQVIAPSTQATDSGDLQPTREELAQMREYTRPWEQHARDRAKLEAEPTVNPVRHHQGRLVEARNTSHADRQKAYDDFTKHPDYQNADPITQMEMESKFHDDWHKGNPDHLANALTAHHEAHKKGSEAMQAFNQTKDEKIRHIATGGNNPDAMSVEEGMQHVGGSRDEDDSSPSGIQQDKGAAFASGNQEFMQQYMNNYDKKAKKFSNISDMDKLDPETRADVSSVLGDHPALKDPAKKRQVDRFVEKYHPLIGKAARHVLSKLGLTDKANRGEIDPGLLHEAGVHALFQATNDYDHDHPSQAKFTTHLNRKMHGLMQTALKTQNEIPDALRTGAKKFDKQRRLENMSPVKHTNKEGVTSVITAPSPKRPVAEIAADHSSDVQDRLKRVAAARSPIVRKQGAMQPKPAAPKPAIKFNMPDEDGEE